MAPIFKIAVLLNLSLYVAAQGKQFITGACSSDADCASACCGFKSGKCAGPVIAQERDGGCGFGDAQPNANAANALTGGTASTPQTSAVAQAADAPSATSAAAAPTSAAGAGNGAGKQFITGACSSDADCASACCGFKSGKCAGPVVAQERDGGCGFGDAQPNANAANALTGGNASPPSASANATAESAGDTTGSASTTQSSAAAGGNGAGNGAGKQFITGPCDSDADCANGCCGFNSGKCAGAVVAQERDGGCGHGNAQPNNNAEQALTGGKRGVRAWMQNVN